VRRERRTASWSNSAVNSRTLRRSFSPAWTFQAALARNLPRLSVYAGMASDQDTRDPKYLGMVQAMGQIGSTFGAKVAYIEPKILSMGKEKIRTFLAREPKLKVYRHNLDDVLRRKLHTGTEPEEKIIADASLMADAPTNIYGIFSNAEFPYPSVTLSDGTTVKLDKAAFTLYRAVPNREDRKRSFSRSSERINEFAQRLARNCTRK